MLMFCEFDAITLPKTLNLTLSLVTLDLMPIPIGPTTIILQDTYLLMLEQC